MCAVFFFIKIHNAYNCVAVHYTVGSIMVFLVFFLLSGSIFIQIKRVTQHFNKNTCGSSVYSGLAELERYRIQTT